MASFALLAPPVPSVVAMSAAAAAKSEKKGLFDWLTDALDKNDLLETDPILQKNDSKNGAPPKPVPAAKKPAPKKQGGGFFGLGKK